MHTLGLYDTRVIVGIHMFVCVCACVWVYVCVCVSVCVCVCCSNPKTHNCMFMFHLSSRHDLKSYICATVVECMWAIKIFTTFREVFIGSGQGSG